jgi:hypothetical protein
MIIKTAYFSEKKYNNKWIHTDYTAARGKTEAAKINLDSSEKEYHKNDNSRRQRDICWQIHLEADLVISATSK